MIIKYIILYKKTYMKGEKNGMKSERKAYKSPNLDVVKFDALDILTTSGGGNGTLDFDGGTGTQGPSGGSWAPVS